MTTTEEKNALYRICTRCVMDTTDPEITFDEEGVCNHCRQFTLVTSKNWFPNAEGARRLSEIIKKIKKGGKNQDYDSILGLSGGVDSSYMALKAREWGLRPLVVHVDAGWNTELAVANIEKIVKYCGYHLHTHVVNWEEMRDLQVAYLRAGVSNQDVPQDHVFFASMYHFAVKHGIRYILSGGNTATEGIFPTSWLGGAMDSINLKAIHRKYGNHPLKTYNTINFLAYYFWYPFVKKMRTVRPLNYLPYNKAAAIEELKKTIGWCPYDRKHGESFFTKLYQNYYLPTKFGYDKRRPHFSSMIVSGQMTRDEALRKLYEPLYDPQELENDIGYCCKKLCVTRDEFDRCLREPNHLYTEFANGDRLQCLIKKVQKIVERALGKNLKVYS